MSDWPTVSIVTATYNRSNVLRLAIDAARRSTVDGWEHLVVGDACTDDTADLVASYRDSRLRFVNLDVNVGEQSGPNNAGMRLATGRFIAMLNHDDLWLPSHLATAIRTLDATGADLVFTLALTIGVSGETRLAGVTRNGVYERGCFAPCSTWVFRRELVDDIGPWRPARTLYGAPSTDWLERAHRAGKALVAIPEVTTIAILSGGRPGSYAERQLSAHADLARTLDTDPGAVTSLVTAAALGLAREHRRVRPLIARAMRNAAMRVVSAAGVHPAALFNAVRYRRTGGFLDHLRHTRGLPPLPRKEHDVG